MDDTPIALDSNWLRTNPLPVPPHDTDKNARGRVLVIGGSSLVPGGLMLTAEAALRAGAGKVRVASVSSITPGIGIAMPEVATLALGEVGDGDIDIAEFFRLESALMSCDVVVLGPAMANPDVAADMTERLLRFLNEAKCRPVLVFDATALLSLSKHRTLVSKCDAPVVLTPPFGRTCGITGV